MMKPTRRPILALYLFRRMLWPSCAFVAVMLLVLSMERLLRLLQLVTDAAHPAYETLELIGYLVPHYLVLAVPAGLFLGVLLGVRGLHERSELVAMSGFGMTAVRMQIPILALAALLCVLLAGVSGFAQPYGRHAYRARATEILTGNILAGLREKIFLKIGDKINIRVDRLDPDGLSFGGFFLSIEEQPGERMIVTAESGLRVPRQEVSPGMAAEMHLRNGKFVKERDTEQGKTITFEMEFGEAPLAIPLEKVAEFTGPRGNDERELTAPELYAGGIPGRNVDATPAEMAAELHTKIAGVLALPVLALLATPLALIGRGRGGKAGGIAVAVIVFIAYEKLGGLGKVLAAKDKIGVLAGIWGPWAALLVFTMVMYLWQVGGGFRGLMDWVRQLMRESNGRRRLAQNRAS